MQGIRQMHLLLLLELANESNGVAFNALKHSFRFHPTYTEIIRKTIYKQLAPAVSEESRSKLLKASIKLPHKDYPFILIHCEHEDKKTASGSRTNAGQTKVALNIFRILSKTNIRAEILTLYSAQAQDLSSEIDPGRVHTVDSYQGKQCELPIIVTTRSGNLSLFEEASANFYQNDRRIVSLMTRGQHGLVLIGNFNTLLKGSSLWTPIIEELVKLTPVITEAYANSMECKIADLWVNNKNKHYVQKVTK